MIECVVYWIYDNNCKNIETDGYVGISTDPDIRLIAHIKNDKFPKPFCMEIIMVGTVRECQTLEKQLRPQQYIGWNVAIGGGLPPKASTMKMITCYVCGKTMRSPNYHQWHGAKCGKPVSPELSEKLASWRGRKHTEETKEKMKKNGNKGKKMPPLSAEARVKIVKANTGRKFGPASDERKLNISNALKGKRLGPRPQTGSAISAALKGRKKTPEHIKKVVASKNRKRRERFQAIAARFDAAINIVGGPHD